MLIGWFNTSFLSLSLQLKTCKEGTHLYITICCMSASLVKPLRYVLLIATKQG
jgi:hypothetical protein